MNQKGVAYLLILILGTVIILASTVYYTSIMVEARVSNNARLVSEVFYHTESSIHQVPQIGRAHV